MKLSVGIIFAGILAVAKGQTLAEKWNITEPTFSFSDNVFDLIYGVHSDMTADNGAYEIYTSGCKEDGDLVTQGAGLTWPGLPTFSDADDTFTTTITIDPTDVKSNSNIYSEDTTIGAVTARIQFCVRFGLKTGGTSSVEVNFLETIVTLDVDLSDGFTIDSVSVAPRDRLVRTAAQAYTVEGFLCNSADGSKITQVEPLNQGALITVCVQPAEDAVNDGIKMRTIDDFTWTRGPTEQIAIDATKAADNQLTTFDDVACVGASYCSFSSILFAAFYATTGQVAGAGTASMQFGARRLSGLRALQAGAESAGVSEFDLNVDLNQGEPLADTTAGAGALSTMLVAVLGVAGAVVMA